MAISISKNDLCRSIGPKVTLRSKPLGMSLKFKRMDNYEKCLKQGSIKDNFETLSYKNQDSNFKTLTLA